MSTRTDRRVQRGSGAGAGRRCHPPSDRRPEAIRSLPTRQRSTSLQLYTTTSLQRWFFTCSERLCSQLGLPCQPILMLGGVPMDTTRRSKRGSRGHAIRRSSTAPRRTATHASHSIAPPLGLVGLDHPSRWVWLDWDFPSHSARTMHPSTIMTYGGERDGRDRVRIRGGLAPISGSFSQPTPLRCVGHPIRHGFMVLGWVGFSSPRRASPRLASPRWSGGGGGHR